MSDHEEDPMNGNKESSQAAATADMKQDPGNIHHSDAFNGYSNVDQAQYYGIIGSFNASKLQKATNESSVETCGAQSSNATMEHLSNESVSERDVLVPEQMNHESDISNRIREADWEEQQQEQISGGIEKQVIDIKKADEIPYTEQVVTKEETKQQEPTISNEAQRPIIAEIQPAIEQLKDDSDMEISPMEEEQEEQQVQQEDVAPAIGEIEHSKIEEFNSPEVIAARRLRVLQKKRRPSKKDINELLSQTKQDSISNIEHVEVRKEKVSKEFETNEPQPTEILPPKETKGVGSERTVAEKEESIETEKKIVEQPTEEERSSLEKKRSFKEMGIKLPILDSMPVLRKSARTSQESEPQPTESDSTPDIAKARNQLRRTSVTQSEPNPPKTPSTNVVDFRPMLRSVNKDSCAPAKKEESATNQIDFRSVLKRGEQQ